MNKMQSSLSVRSILRKTADELKETAREEAETEARELVMRALKTENRAELGLYMDKEMSQSELEELNKLTARRKKGEPLQYILGFWEFMGLRFKTDARALIPRQDTETLCEEAIKLIKSRGYKTCLDMCAGSGCIGISLAKIAGVETTLADISEAALELSRENAKANGVSIKTIKTDMFTGIADKYDIIVCNPPYLTDDDMNSLQKELEFEPENALCGGPDGLDFYRRIANDYKAALNEGGALLLEVGIYQANDVAKMLGGARIIKDILGIERTVIKE
jgi:release factor glutamine methyltransferase